MDERKRETSFQFDIRKGVSFQCELVVRNWDLNLEFQMLVALRVIATSEWSRIGLL